MYWVGVGHMLPKAAFPQELTVPRAPNTPNNWQAALSPGQPSSPSSWNGWRGAQGHGTARAPQARGFWQPPEPPDPLVSAQMADKSPATPSGWNACSNKILNCGIHLLYFIFSLANGTKAVFTKATTLFSITYTKAANSGKNIPRPTKEIYH